MLFSLKQRMIGMLRVLAAHGYRERVLTAGPMTETDLVHHSPGAEIVAVPGVKAALATVLVMVSRNYMMRLMAAGRLLARLCDCGSVEGYAVQAEIHRWDASICESTRASHISFILPRRYIIASMC